MAEWFDTYKGCNDREVIAQALNACAKKDCAHCLYQGMGIVCRKRLLEDAAKMLQKEVTS